MATENWEVVIFQDLGSNPASMEAGKACDAYGCFPGHVIEQADAEQAYVQADLKGTVTWINIPEEGWPADWWNADGTPKYKRPVVRLLKALYGHPDAGTFWEGHCDKALQKQGFKPIPNWGSCYFHNKMKVFLTVYVDDFKMSGPPDACKCAWKRIRTDLQIEDPISVDHYLGCKHNPFERRIGKTIVRG